MPTSAYIPVKTKVTLPPSRPQLVLRRRLLDRLQQGLTRTLTIISAPAGFGKTTLVSSWLQQAENRSRVAWLSLDEDDNDPIRFLYYLVAALQTLQPGAGQTPILLLGSPYVLNPRDLMTLLFNEIPQSDEPIVLVLNDYHVIDNPEIDTALAYCIDHAPEQLRLVLISREEPNLPLPRWRSHHCICEIGAEELRFSSDEAEQFLKQTMNLELDATAVQAIGSRTEGWIAGLQMAALSLQHHMEIGDLGKAAETMAAFSGEHYYVMDYLATEVLRHQEPDIVAFLQQTSILERLCAPLCDAVTGRTDSKAVLAQLEHANMFLLRLDDRRCWYRYHQLFADFLRAGLDAKQQQAVQGRASAWHEAQGLGHQAMKHALAAQDITSAVRIFRAHAETVLGRGEIPTLLSWLDALPDHEVRSHGDLAGYKAWLLYMKGSTTAAKDYAGLAGMTEDSDTAATRRGMSLSLQAIMAINWDNPQRAVQLAEEALKQFGDKLSFFRVHALSFLGQAQSLSGQPTVAQKTLRQAIELAKRLGNDLIALDALTHLVPLMYAQGRLREALLLCREAAGQHVDNRGEPLPLAGLAYVQMGVLYYQMNELEQARNDLTRGIALCRQLGMVYHTVIGLRALAKVQFVEGDRESAWNTLAAARAFAEWSNSPRRQRLVISVIAELQLREGNTAAAEGTLAELRPLMKATSENERLLQVRLWLAQDQPDQAENELHLLEQAATEEKREGSLIEICVLQALCRQAQAKRPAAVKRLEYAVSLAASKGYCRIFLDEGLALAGLLRGARHIAPDFVAGLLAALPDTDKTAALGLAEPMSHSQLEILALLDQGLTNKEIAEKLAITIGTTKWHLNQIFSKLQVHNRTAAIAVARRLGLL